MEKIKEKGKRKSIGQRKPMGDKIQEWLANNPKVENFVKQTSDFIKDPNKLNNAITEAYNKATSQSGNKSLVDMWVKIKALGRMIRSSYNNEYNGLSKPKMVVGAIVLLYFVMPIDIMPDFLPVIGFADDAALMLWFIKYASEEIDKFELWEKNVNVPQLS